jgi:hypothetical protein
VWFLRREIRAAAADFCARSEGEVPVLRLDENRSGAERFRGRRGVRKIRIVIEFRPAGHVRTLRRAGALRFWLLTLAAARGDDSGPTTSRAARRRRKSAAHHADREMV